MPQAAQIVGIDVSKRWLDSHVLAGAHERRVTNDPAGHAELVDWLTSLGVTMAVLEASGGYEQAVVKALRRGGLIVRVVDPKRIRHYAKAAGRRAKNDRIDARVIAEFGAVINLAGRCEIDLEDPAREALGALVAARQDLIEHHVGLLQQAASTADGPARGALVVAAQAMARQIARVDKRIATTIARHPPFAALAKRLDTMPGIGPVAIAAIIAWLPELGRLDRGKIAALVGVAPYDADSGERRGQRYIQGGRMKLRNILYMATMAAATRHNPVLHAHYTRLRANGKEAKVAIIACLRKLLTILNTMIAREQDWQPDLATARALAMPA